MSVFRVGSNKSSVNNFPSVRPTLDLDFANSKTLDPRITFTRASGGSYVGADGYIKFAGVNEARFDHDPVTGESLGLLVEESRTNLVTYSTYNPSGWGNVFPVNATLSTGIDAPDGSNTAVRFSCTPTGSSLLRLSFPSFTPDGTTAFTCSFYARLISGTTSTANALSFDLADRTPGGNYLPFLVKDKWVRVVFTGTPSSAFVISFMDLLSDNTNNYTIDYWGAQLEVGSFPTSYIPTVGSTRTRAADNARITGKNFSEWYRQDEGTVYCEVTHGLTNYRAMFYSISRGITNNYNIQYYKEPTANLLYNSNITNQDFIGWNSYGTVPYNKSVKTARSYIENNLIHSINGNIFNTVSSSGFGDRQPGDYNAKIPVELNRLTIGNHPSIGSSRQNGTIKRFTYFPKRLPNAQLQALTK